MKRLLLICILMALGGCAIQTGSYDPATGKVDFSSRTLWKDVKDLQVTWGDFSGSLGSSTGNGGESAVLNDFIACYLSPALCAQPKQQP